MQNLGGRTPFAPKAHKCCGHVIGAIAFDELGGECCLLSRTVRQKRQLHQAGVITLLHLFGRRGLAPFRHDLRPLQKARRLAEFRRWHDQNRGPLLARAPRPARTVQKCLAVRGQVGMDHQLQPRQVDATRGHVGRDADPRATVTQRLQRMHAFRLRQLTRQRHDLEAAVAHAGQQVVHVHPRLAEDDGGLRLVKAQHVEDGVLAVARGDVDRAVFDVAMLARLTLRLQAHGITLEGGGKLFDLFRHGGREHQRATFRRGRAQDELQILGKAQVQHLVRLVQHGNMQERHIKAAALDMVPQTAGCSDHDMRAKRQRPAFGAIVHAAHASGDLGTGLGIKPFQFARDLLGQLARRRDDQGQRGLGRFQDIRATQDLGRHGKAKGHGLARPGLRRNQRVAADQFRGQNGLLHGGKRFIAFGGKRRCERGRDIQLGHVCSNVGASCP